MKIKTTTGDSPPVHIHPHGQESCQIISGVLEINGRGVETGECWREATCTSQYSTYVQKQKPVEIIDVHKPHLSMSDSP